MYHVEKPHGEKVSKESVHLESWPKLGQVSRDSEVLTAMQKVRDVVTGALELRQKAGIKVRQPLSSLTISENFGKEYLDIISDELNVKQVIVKVGETVTLDTTLTSELKNEGIARDIIRAIQDVRKKEGLNPGESISLTVQANEALKEIFDSYKEMISLPTLVSVFLFVEEKQKHEIALEDSLFSVSVSK